MKKSKPLAPGHSAATAFVTTELVEFKLDDNAIGAIQTINNIVNMTVVSRDANNLRAEYRAGFVQGKLQNRTILSARDNSWDNAYLTDPHHHFPGKLPPDKRDLDIAKNILITNYRYFLQYIKERSNDNLKRLLFRMLGIYHGVILDKPADLDFKGQWLPDFSYLKPEELDLGYETKTLTFMDVYCINAFNDLTDVISAAPECSARGKRLGDFPHKCSAFLKRCASDIILSHNSWTGFLSQTMVQTLLVNKDWLIVNAATPGLIGSGTDFGYNNKGVMFNETTHRMNNIKPRIDGVWIFWRSALAEQFSSSIKEFFDAISLDNTGTYLNRYMLIDAKTNQTGLVEMSHSCFIYYLSKKDGSYEVTCKPTDGACSREYDKQMVTESYLMGINFPASEQVRFDLDSTDNRPARRIQFNRLLPRVNNIDHAKSVITYIDDPVNPLSIFGRWDLGYGDTRYPKTIPDGSVDAKAADTSMVITFMKLSGIYDRSSQATGFFMLYGTPWVNGKPFVWSASMWPKQKLRDVPDRLDGIFTRMPLYLR